MRCLKIKLIKEQRIEENYVRDEEGRYKITWPCAEKELVGLDL